MLSLKLQDIDEEIRQLLEEIEAPDGKPSDPENKDSPPEFKGSSHSRNGVPQHGSTQSRSVASPLARSGNSWSSPINGLQRNEQQQRASSKVCTAMSSSEHNSDWRSPRAAPDDANADCQLKSIEELRPSTAQVEQLVLEELEYRHPRPLNPHAERLSLLEELQNRCSENAEASDQHRPSTAQADRLILEEFQWRKGLSNESFHASSSSWRKPSNEHSDVMAPNGATCNANPQPSIPVEAAHNVTRPTTAQADELVLDEMLRREAQRLSGYKHWHVEEAKPPTAQAPTTSIGSVEFRPITVSSIGGELPPMIVSRPTTAQAEQLVAEEIQAWPLNSGQFEEFQLRPSTAQVEELVREEIATL